MRPADVRYREEELIRRAGHCQNIAKSGLLQHSHVKANNLNDSSEQQTLARDRRSMNFYSVYSISQVKQYAGNVCIAFETRT